ncbi:3298_t:CDS:2, partial [Funneliformis geosporum]
IRNKDVPKEKAYIERLETYCKRYEDNDLYTSLEELYELYYHIAKEENRERSNDEIEQILIAMAIYSFKMATKITGLEDIINNTSKNIKKVFQNSVKPEDKQEAYIIGLKLILDRLARELEFMQNNYQGMSSNQIN